MRVSARRGRAYWLAAALLVTASCARAVAPAEALEEPYGPYCSAREVGINFVADDLPGGVVTNVSSYAACCDLCWSEPLCGAFTWFAIGTLANRTDTECALKLPSGFFPIEDRQKQLTYISGQLVSPRLADGTCSTPQEGTNLVGGDVNYGVIRNITDYAVCCEKCATSPFCEAFTLDRTAGTCTLKLAGAYIAQAANASFVSGTVSTSKNKFVAGNALCGAPQVEREFRGGDLPGGTIANVSTFADCCSLCAGRQPDCRAVTLDARTNLCLLKGDGYTAKTVAWAVSGTFGAADATAQAPTSSAAPIGAIVGGVMGGAVVLCATAVFLLLRARKARLRAAPTGSVVAPAADVGIDSKIGSDLPSVSAKLATPAAPTARPAPDSCLPLDGSQLPASWNASLGSALSVGLYSLDRDPEFALITSCLTASMHSRAAKQPGSTGSSGALMLPASMHKWEVKWEELAIERVIGRGSYGKVYLGRWRETTVAVKVLLSVEGLSLGQLELPDEIMRELQQEAALMARMRHPHITNFLGLCAMPPCIVTEFVPRGSLYDVLRAARLDTSRAAELTWRRRLSMAADAATGMLYLHLLNPTIIHRDLKSANMLVAADWRVKIADFNLTTIFSPHHQEAHPVANNPLWNAPEVLQGALYGTASDVYAFAVILLELLTWRLPWQDTNVFAVARAVLGGGRPEVPPREALPGPDTASFAGLDVYCQLMRECWSQDPRQRPSFSDIVPRLRALLDLAP